MKNHCRNSYFEILQKPFFRKIYLQVIHRMTILKKYNNLSKVKYNANIVLDIHQ